MAQSPGLYLLALFLWLLPLIALPSELRFLRRTPGVPPSQWVLSGLIFVCFVILNLTLLFHPILNILVLTTIVLSMLLLMIVLSMMLLNGRMRLFTKLSEERRAQHREMLEGVRDLIDEKKREKIRARYGD